MLYKTSLGSLHRYYVPISTFHFPLLFHIGETTITLYPVTIIFPKCKIQSQLEDKGLT